MQLYRQAKEIEQAGASLTLIGQASPRHAAHFRRRQEIELPVLADADRRSYAAAGAKVATLNELVGPKMLAKGIGSALRTGQMQGKVVGHPAQLGGVLVVRPDGTVAWSHMSDDASDNATPEAIAAAVRAA